MLGQTLKTSRPDFDLFQHLWKKRLIDTEDLRELQGGGHYLAKPPGNFVWSERGQRANSGGDHEVVQRWFTEEALSTEEDIHSTPNEPRNDQMQSRVLAEQNNQTSTYDERGDSGYGTMSNTAHTGGRLEDDNISIRTMLSDASLVFQPPQERENLISAFVEDLCGDTKFGELSENGRERAISQLSDLLKMFSLRLEASAMSQEERDAKDFIRQQREYVT
jgi:hypothetical protein|tara:strand:- start:7484 stop:8143 length:660 start_codon:yes stop_codon:yes gene_type:complete